MKRLGIGLLKCDSFIPEIRSEYGDIDVQFKKLMDSNTLNTKVDLTVFECVDGDFPSKEEILQSSKDKESRFNGGFIISGSRSSVNDDKPWIDKLKDYIRFFNDNSIKTVGICFGHQAIATALNGSVITNDKGWQVSDYNFKFINDYSAENNTYIQSFKDKYNEINQGNHQANIICLNKQIVDKVPEGFKILGYNEKCDNHMMIKENKFLTLQGHPEFTPKLINSILLSRKGIIPDDIINDGIKRSQSSHIPQELYANLIISFLSSK